MISKKANMMNLWKGISKRFVSQDVNNEKTAPELKSYCLQLLNSCTAGTALYILNCLFPDDFDLVFDLLRFDLDFPHQHKWLSEKDMTPKSDSYKDVLAILQARTNLIPMKDYPHFWLDLTKSWLLSCPVDPEYYLAEEAGKDLYCQKLRGELVERILNIT